MTWLTDFSDPLSGRRAKALAPDTGSYRFRRLLLKTRAAALTAALTAAAALAPAQAQDYPAKPVRFVVGFAPGGGGDVIARIVTAPLPAILGQQVIIDNRPGATGTVGAGLVAKSPPDGYTLYVGATSTNSIAPTLYHNLPYDSEKDLVGVTLLASLPNVISVHPSLGLNSLKELIAYAKANPGKLSFPSAGYGSTPHLAGEMFKMATGTNLLHVPYKGAGQAVPDLLSGVVTVSFDTTGTVISYILAGRLKALAIASAKRFPLIPDVPTAREAGVPGYEVSTWIGLFAPAATPRPIVKKLHDDIAQILRSPEMREKLLVQLGCDDTTTDTPEDFDKVVASDTAKYAKMIKALHLRVD
ncbi:MAG TPA: tripartite tricarboxylate transporter substrate binding protein [Burkholderiales bacterium]|nr:tripartite tricarboxylate transporter substrate binding protein [Burkholderiales bacterium]